MTPRHFILGTAGHVDHGKTALIKALTGTDTDRLPEEKRRGITIELGFAHLALNDDSIGIVDVPGHEDFVKNMVGGVGSIDLALLVVAADDGWMPQTEEHLQILAYLGVPRVVVALTKIDLVESEEEVERGVHAQLANSPYAEAPIVRTSIFDGRGVDELKAALASEFADLIPQPDIGKPRLAVDRAFTLRGIGTVVTGTLIGGTLRKGDAIAIQPANIPGRIRALQNHNREVDVIGPGTRAALNLADVPAASDRSEAGVWRGDVVTLPHLGSAHDPIDVLLTRSARLPRQTPPLKHGASVSVHHGSGHYPARLFFGNAAALAPGESGIAQLRFAYPVFVFAGDRFVVRDPSARRTVAGGVVLDPAGSSESFRQPAQRKLLRERAAASQSVGIFLRTQLARDRVVRRADVLVASRWSAAQVASAIDDCCKTGAALERAGLIIDSAWWRDVRRRAVEFIEAEHAAHSDRTGLELNRLRSFLAHDLPSPEAFPVLVSDLCANGFARSGDVIHRANHQPSAPPALQPAIARIRAALAAKPFDPPSRKELAPDAISQQALRFLRETKEAVEVGADLILSGAALNEMRARVVEFIREHGAASVSELRQALASSRRVVVPLLEHLDQTNITRRTGDKRVLASTSTR